AVSRGGSLKDLGIYEEILKDYKDVSADIGAIARKDLVAHYEAVGKAHLADIRNKKAAAVAHSKEIALLERQAAKDQLELETAKAKAIMANNAKVAAHKKQLIKEEEARQADILSKSRATNSALLKANQETVALQRVVNNTGRDSVESSKLRYIQQEKTLTQELTKAVDALSVKYAAGDITYRQA
ncbi:MAG: hypothetical protein P1S59_14700, partial [bacterium]|nr:hypothetical protein [bacterium]